MATPVGLTEQSFDIAKQVIRHVVNDLVGIEKKVLACRHAGGISIDHFRSFLIDQAPYRASNILQLCGHFLRALTDRQMRTEQSAHFGRFVVRVRRFFFLFILVILKRRKSLMLTMPCYAPAALSRSSHPCLRIKE
jgi:hypothetical protein